MTDIKTDSFDINISKIFLLSRDYYVLIKSKILLTDVDVVSHLNYKF